MIPLLLDEILGALGKEKESEEITGKILEMKKKRANHSF